MSDKKTTRHLDKPISDDQIIAAMSHYGGGFVMKVAELYQLADEHNRARLKVAFLDYWKQYHEVAALKAQGVLR